MSIFGNGKFADFGARLQRFGDAVDTGGQSLMQPQVKPGNKLNRLGHGLMAMGAGFQGEDVSSFVQDYQDSLERARQQQAISGLLGISGIGQANQPRPQARPGLSDWPGQYLGRLAQGGFTSPLGRSGYSEPQRRRKTISKQL